MATLVQIVLIIVFVSLADCRLRIGLYKHIIPGSLIEDQKIEKDKNVSADQFHQTAEIKTNANYLINKDANTLKDADAIVFPSDVDGKIYTDVTQIANKDPNVVDNDKDNIGADTTANGVKETVAVPLISKLVPAVEAKEVFTNTILLEGNKNVTVQTIEDKENVPTTIKPIQEPAEIAVAIDTNVNITVDDIKELQMSNDTASSNETVPDFQSRFGATDNYMLVPVNSVQYQPIPMIQNAQGGSPLTYVANNDQGNAFPLGANYDANSQYVTPNFASNIGSNPQYTANANVAPNVGLNLYASPVNTQSGSPMNYDGNVAQGNNYIPINVPNTYMINGQLYAAVTVPNNVNVPNSLYFVNPQVPAYQVANNLPLYKLVSVGSQGGQVGGQVGLANNVNNAQYM